MLLPMLAIWRELSNLSDQPTVDRFAQQDRIITITPGQEGENLIGVESTNSARSFIIGLDTQCVLAASPAQPPLVSLAVGANDLIALSGANWVGNSEIIVCAGLYFRVYIPPNIVGTAIDLQMQVTRVLPGNGGFITIQEPAFGFQATRLSNSGDTYTGVAMLFSDKVGNVRTIARGELSKSNAGAAVGNVIVNVSGVLPAGVIVSVVPMTARLGFDLYQAFDALVAPALLEAIEDGRTPTLPTTGRVRAELKKVIADPQEAARRFTSIATMNREDEGEIGVAQEAERPKRKRGKKGGWLKRMLS